MMVAIIPPEFSALLWVCGVGVGVAGTLVSETVGATVGDGASEVVDVASWMVDAVETAIYIITMGFSTQYVCVGLRTCGWNSDIHCRTVAPTMVTPTFEGTVDVQQRSFMYWFIPGGNSYDYFFTHSLLSHWLAVIGRACSEFCWADKYRHTVWWQFNSIVEHFTTDLQSWISGL